MSKKIENTLTVFTHPDCELHDIPNHVESPQRLKELLSRLQKSKQFKIQLEQAPFATKEQLALAHAKNYIESLFAIAPEQGIRRIDSDTAMMPDTLNAALHAATQSSCVLCDTSPWSSCRNESANNGGILFL